MRLKPFVTSFRARAFTLIELLVVIAIIAILAAILFPVFAQAKLAAKKTVALAQMKQQGTATAIYETDSDDLFPQGIVQYNGIWRSNAVLCTPYNWDGNRSEANQNIDALGWANSTQPYRKNFDLLEPPGQDEFEYPYIDLSMVTVKRANVGFQFNGLLGVYSASAVASPSQLTMYGQTNGREVIRGFSYSSPRLNCPNGADACVYRPSTPGCAGKTNGDMSVTQGGTFGSRSRWAYGRGLIVVMTDTSARFKQVGMNVQPSGSTADVYTDFRKDMFFDYDAKGVPGGEWQDTNFCHSLLYQPDFDFQDFGTPYPWKRTGL